MDNVDTLSYSLESELEIFLMDNRGEATELEVEFQPQHLLFLFVEEGQVICSGSMDPVSKPLSSDSFLMASYPVEAWSLYLNMEMKTTVKGILISLKKLHELLGAGEFHKTPGFREEIRNFRSSSALTLHPYQPKQRVTLHQLFEDCSGGISQQIFRVSKVLEFLAYYMGTSRNESVEGCPYIKNQTDVDKLREAEDILVKNYRTPPTIKELARMVGTNELKLKAGFKYLYRKTIYNYITDHRMDTARLFLDGKGLKVIDVADQVGYRNPSHFIAAFRKKFGVTPKKYLQNSL